MMRGQKNIKLNKCLCNSLLFTQFIFLKTVYNVVTSALLQAEQTDILWSTVHTNWANERIAVSTTQLAHTHAHTNTYKPRDRHMTGYRNIHALFECFYEYTGRLFILKANQALISSITVPVPWSRCAGVLKLHILLFLQSRLLPHRGHSSCSTVSFGSQTTSHRTWQLGNYGYKGISYREMIHTHTHTHTHTHKHTYIYIYRVFHDFRA